MFFVLCFSHPIYIGHFSNFVTPSYLGSSSWSFTSLGYRCKIFVQDLLFCLLVMCPAYFHFNFLILSMMSKTMMPYFLSRFFFTFFFLTLLVYIHLVSINFSIVCCLLLIFVPSILLTFMVSSLQVSADKTH